MGDFEIGNHTDQNKASSQAGDYDPNRTYRVLIADLVGLCFDAEGHPDASEVKTYIQSLGATFTEAGWDGSDLPAGVHFFYLPNLSTPDELAAICCDNQYDAVIAAATFLPEAATFPEGGVRIGAGTGNMVCTCWGGGDGVGGAAPLMNTPSFNSRATAQALFKALLRVLPDLKEEEMHARVVDGNFDTGKDLRDYPTVKLEGKRIGVIGYGNIGREVAKLARAFGMQVAIHARPHHQPWIESEGFLYAATPQDAARDADILSPHIGLGAKGADGRFANAGLVDASVLTGLNDGAVLINYDRGELVDTDALNAALSSGKVAYAAIDADLFMQEDGRLTGPMVPYRPLAEAFPGRLQLLPHAAADTEHRSRVEGAKQAVDQILTAICQRRVVNAKGDIPPGYTDGGAQTVPGVGKVTADRIAAVAARSEVIARLRETSELLSTVWTAIDEAQDESARNRLIKTHGSAVTRASNLLHRDLEDMGLLGSFCDKDTRE